MAKYLILIYGPESDAAPTPKQWDQMMQAHGQFAQAVDSHHHDRASASIEPAVVDVECLPELGQEGSPATQTPPGTEQGSAKQALPHRTTQNA